jgi:uncharacterized repeat protein (TIGR01451 family)
MKTTISAGLKLFALSLVLLIGLKTAPVLAQNVAAPASTEQVKSILSSKKVVISADKKESLVEAREIKPGEIIEYQVIFTNQGTTPVSRVMGNLPIPEGTEFIAGSAKPGIGVRATLGDGKFDPIPLKRKVKGPDGKEVEQDVPLALYRALQWTLGDLAPGKTASVTARIKVTEGPPPAPAAPPKAAPPLPSTTGGAK